MLSPQVHHRHVGNAPRILVNGPRAIRPQELGSAMAGAFFDSTEEEFHRIAPQFWNIYCRELFGHHAELASDFLVVIREDESADIYAGNIPKKLGFRAKRAIGANEWLSLRDMADITAQTFINIEIRESDSLVYCFRHGWRHGLFFDMRIGNGDSLVVDELYRRLGHAHRHLIFFDDYVAYGKAENNGLIGDGWFPFIQLLGGEYATLVDYYDQDDRDLLVEEFVNAFAGARATAVVESWFSDPTFDAKKDILRSGLEAFNAKTASGAILCLKAYLSEIEGIIRFKLASEPGAVLRPRQSDLFTFVANKGRAKFDTHSPAFPEAFFDYLKDSLFADFDMTGGQVPLSRHSAAHGVASANTYTRARALQAILALDQLFFYLT